MIESSSISASDHAQATRPHDAPAVRLRDQHGAVTKRRILQAARTCFATHGYARTAVKQIAAEAGVAIQTLYRAFGSKGGVVLGLTDLVDEEAGALPLFETMMGTQDPRDALPVFARMRRQIRERCGDMIAVLRAGAGSDPEVGAAWAEGMRRRHAGIARIVARLESADLLRPDLDAAHAADVLAALVTDDVCDVLVDQGGWTFDEYEAWLHETMAALVLRPGG